MAVATKLKKAAFQHIEAELYCYHDTLKEIQMIRNSIMFCREGVDENIGGGRDSLSGKTMESIAVRLAAHKRLAPLEERANAIERTGIYTIAGKVSKADSIMGLDKTVYMGWTS
ncbi:hypothetical protein [Saccharococcus caldoxylosilyticus]|uniref:Uncharacterized protein n=1 Tax=Saccharococcus caldoxylosilyticus TaxID=81408 RepID=A0A150LVV5_9BACL|nr:hypothetical protein [Parageobacillus caldoxylosilyticus]KYD16430.1 hypothetical protein B4119_1843 [Parageobacillus caldoxylosilyticus]